LEELHGSHNWIYLQLIFPLDYQRKLFLAFAFIHPISKQRYNFTRLAMGGKPSQASLEALMLHVLRRSKNCLNYSDDLFLVGKKGTYIEQHLQELRILIEDLKEACLKIKSKKIRILTKTCTVLGYPFSVDSGTFFIPVARCNAFLNLATPKNKWLADEFLNSIQYFGRFLPYLAQLQLTIRDML